MRIGLDYRPVSAAPFSGIARQVIALEQALLSREGVEVLRFTSCPTDHPHRKIAYCPEQGVSTKILHRPQERWRFENTFLSKALAQTQPDMYIATPNSGLPWPNAPKEILYGVMLFDLFQLTLENRHPNFLKSFIYRQLDQIEISVSIKKAHALIVPSRFTEREVVRLFPKAADKLRLLPCAVPAPDDSLVSFRLVSSPYWLLVGSREPRKNIPWFVSQWKTARQVHPEASIPDLVLVGSPGDLPVAQRNISGLHVLEAVSETELASLYYYAECFWHPAYAEGFGLPVIEAMQYGTPVAVATGSSLDEITLPQAPRFDPHDGVSLQKLMLQLAQGNVKDAESRDTLQRWAAQFEMPAYTARVWQLLDPLLKRRACA